MTAALVIFLTVAIALPTVLFLIVVVVALRSEETSTKHAQVSPWQMPPPAPPMPYSAWQDTESHL